MKLRRRDRAQRPGLVRTARVDRRVDALVARARPGDIAVIDVIDLDRRTAEQLVTAGVSAVVNAAPSSSGRFPVHGPQTLLQAGVLLVDGVGGDVFSRVRDGDTVRLDGNVVYAAGEPVVEGLLQSDATVAARDALSRQDMAGRLAALVGDAARRLSADGERIIEGDGFPPLSVRWADRVVVIVTDAATPDELRLARRLVRRRRAFVLAVGAGADLAATVRLRPDLLVVGRGVTPATLARAREVLVLDGADLDVPVPTGVPRAHTTSIGTPEDTAVLLAHVRGAALVVSCGLDESFGGLLDRSVASGSMPLLSRLRGGGRHVAAAASVAVDGRSRRGPVGPAVALLAAGCLVAGAALGAGPLGTVVRPALDGGGDVETELAEANRSLADAAQYDAAVAPLVVGKQLSGHVVTPVVLPGATVPRGLVAALGESGADVNEPLRLTADYLDPDRAMVLADLADQVRPDAAAVPRPSAGSPSSVPSSAPAASPGPTAGPTSGAPGSTGVATAGPTAAQRLDRVLAGALVAGDAAQLGRTESNDATVIKAFGRVGALVEPTRPLRAADLLVVIAPQAAGAEQLARSRDLVAVLTGAADGVVVAAPGRPGGLVGALRAEPGPVAVTTVDGAGGALGRLAVVLGLAAAARHAEPGHYGASSTRSPLPPTAPRGGSGSGTAPSD